MDLLCDVCDKDIIENKNEYKSYIASLHKKDDKTYIKNMLLIILIWMNLIKYQFIISLITTKNLIYIFSNVIFK